MDMDQQLLQSILRALIFASEEPLGLPAILGALESEEISKDELQTALGALMEEYAEGKCGILLRKIGGGYQFVTEPRVAPFVQKLNAAKPRSLTQAALETLSIIAYRQPIVRSEIETIRGVDSGGVLKTLLERGFLRIVGRREEAGQPLIYGTTSAFLELFHLSNLEELPSMKEIEAIVEEQNQKREGEELTFEAVEKEIVEETSVETALAREEVVEEESKVLEDLEGSLRRLKEVEKTVFPKEDKEETNEKEPPINSEPN